MTNLPDYVQELAELNIHSIHCLVDYEEAFSEDDPEIKILENWEVAAQSQFIEEHKGCNSVRHVLCHKPSSTYWSVLGYTSYWDGGDIYWKTVKQVERKEKLVYIYE